MTDEHTSPVEHTPSPPSDLESLDILVGTWDISGGAQGRVTYAWMEGGFFLIQRFDFNHGGHTIRGMEIIGHLRPFGEAPSEDIRSRVYDTVGNTLEYVYEVAGATLTIWGGERGSPAYYQGTFSEDGSSCAGGWVYPGGGGYDTTMTHVTHTAELRNAVPSS